MSAAPFILRPLVGSFVAALLPSCIDGAGGSASELAQPDAAASIAPARCDPLVAEEQAIALGSLLAAGRARDGTLYVVDHSFDGEERLFVSEGDRLVRRRVLGGGSSSAGRDSWLFEDGATRRILFVERAGGLTTSIAIAIDTGPRELADYGSAAELLALADKDAVRELQVVNLPGEVLLEYLSRLGDGRVMVVTRPRDDWSYEDFRLFFGSEERVVERVVESVQRGKGGGTTWIVFDADEQRYEALFPAQIDEPAALPTLSAESGSWTMTREEPVSGALAALAFECLP